MKQVPCWWSTNNRHHRSKLSRQGDLAPGNCAPYFGLLYKTPSYSVLHFSVSGLVAC